MNSIQRRATNRAASPAPWKSDSWVPYFNFSATLRISDIGVRHDEISRVTGLAPTMVHLAGEQRANRGLETWARDLWSLKSPRPKPEPLIVHLDWLWTEVGPHVEYFNSLIADGAFVDIFCGYISDCDHCGFDLAPG